MDGDTDLMFLPGGVAHMFEYGFAVSEYPGTYSVNAKGEVNTRFPTFGHPWPVMTLSRDATSLLLRPTGAGNGFMMGNRGGATILGGRGSYWPFRPVTLAEEMEMRGASKSDADRLSVIDVRCGV